MFGGLYSEVQVEQVEGGEARTLYRRDRPEAQPRPVNRRNDMTENMT